MIENQGSIKKDIGFTDNKEQTIIYNERDKWEPKQPLSLELYLIYSK